MAAIHEKALIPSEVDTTSPTATLSKIRTGREEIVISKPGGDGRDQRPTPLKALLVSLPTRTNVILNEPLIPLWSGLNVRF
ncbi:MAG: hypothetical protein ACRELG_26735 [Gemmataceae bacterium]